MSEETPNDPSLEKEIALLRGLIKEAGDSRKERKLEETLAVLDSVADATPKLANALKSQREMAHSSQDPLEILRLALAELEKEWPELHEVKEQLRSGGTEPLSGGGV
jgi:DNA repair exonuclease SbcCD ATPase subunit